MRVVELSNHPRALMRQAAEQRQAEQAAAEARCESAAEEQQIRIAELRGERAQARSERRWWAWWRLGFPLRRAERNMPRPPAPAPGPSDREQALAAGMEGESLVEEYLQSMLDDDWTLVRGYRNRRGEIDHILLGPTRIVAIEVKHRNATVHCNGDEWWFDKFDRYGNLVEQGSLADRRGRSPSQQLNQPVDELLKFLTSRGLLPEIVRVVYLSHDRSMLGNCESPTVHICTSPDYILTLATPEFATLRMPPEQLAQIEALIIRDHRFHETRRRPR